MMDLSGNTSGDGATTCRYGVSRLICRGPRRQLDKPYVAFAGSSEFYGRFIESPLPALVEDRIGETCANFAAVNGGIDAYVNDPTLTRLFSQASCTVLQVMGANFLSNRFYTVHPRRNDRFLRTSTVLDAIYPDVDFSEFTFTRHMLTALHETDPDRFDIVVSELREAWLARMKTLIAAIQSPVVLAWFTMEDLDDTPWQDRPAGLHANPLFVTASMVDTLRPLVREVVDLQPSRMAIAAGTRGMTFTQLQRAAAEEMLGPACHVEAADHLAERLRRVADVAA
ncbi:hypothetical protein EU805_02895 [Salipiger sp. IMCC34102]|uniref:DUF6473 family protein n=1 Tax=Salipiger sp. IMCC34102 TaxID=2510647 RepID=UPI00101C6E7D|nr:DUF6473 family protein [Salipiger sp. IMCC34102]RYH04332.1 hypothetical protein EU805_02895 [Salipiger sp. IMCC34102]